MQRNEAEQLEGSQGARHTNPGKGGIGDNTDMAKKEQTRQDPTSSTI